MKSSGVFSSVSRYLFCPPCHHLCGILSRETSVLHNIVLSSWRSIFDLEYSFGSHIFLMCKWSVGTLVPPYPLYVLFYSNMYHCHRKSLCVNSSSLEPGILLFLFLPLHFCRPSASRISEPGYKEGIAASLGKLSLLNAYGTALKRGSPTQY